MNSSSPINVLGICGSLRKASLNGALLRCAQRAAPNTIRFSTADISDIPPYNQDVNDLGFPPSVERFRRQVASADALLFVTPEYNYSIPGLLKNALDWASRGADQPFAHKPAAIMGASAGRFATARAQYHLRQVLVFLNVHPLNQPEIMIPTAQNLIGPDGEMRDDTTEAYLRKQLDALYIWTLHLQESSKPNKID
ncbi:NADPH-dependent FMN reductase [Paenalcaligenes niemegkensis]|uniref:NADPH-dependent FMN reductase n=1 Tax=Paenalcaligenes niemegkensis TaxID=2895469 RepID=UPI0027E2FAE2|nr:NAD(P)H-dependent oxidoreductase [Paenalcaligenes niemegkensis]